MRKRPRRCGSLSFRKSQELQAPEPIRIRKSEIERVKVFKLPNLKWIT